MTICPETLVLEATSKAPEETLTCDREAGHEDLLHHQPGTPGNHFWVQDSGDDEA